MIAAVTGASGFIGSALCRRLENDGKTVRAFTRQDPGNIEVVKDWKPRLAGVDVVFHLAAHVHVRPGSPADDPLMYQRVNVDATASLADAAVAAGVRRFVFLSTAGVHGRESVRPFVETDSFRPFNLYTESKARAESELMKRGAEIEVTIVRAPLVYGVGAPGSFGLLLRAIARHVPLPFGRVRNRRSIVALENLVDALIAVSLETAAANAAFLISDLEISTPELVKRLSRALRQPPLLVPLPVVLLKPFERIPSVGRRLQPLLHSLEIDSSKLRAIGWRPRADPDRALEQAARALER